jgi:hypothetical protein
MPKLDVTVPSNLPPEEAAARAKKMVAGLQAQYKDQIRNVRETWNGNNADFSFEFMGFSVSGNFIVEPGKAHLSFNLPLAATPFKSRIETAIREKATTLFAEDY